MKLFDLWNLPINSFCKKNNLLLLLNEPADRKFSFKEFKKEIFNNILRRSGKVLRRRQLFN